MLGKTLFGGRVRLRGIGCLWVALLALVVSGWSYAQDQTYLIQEKQSTINAQGDRISRAITVGTLLIKKRRVKTTASILLKTGNGIITLRLSYQQASADGDAWSFSNKLAPYRWSSVAKTLPPWKNKGLSVLDRLALKPEGAIYIRPDIRRAEVSGIDRKHLGQLNFRHFKHSDFANSFTAWAGQKGGATQIPIYDPASSLTDMTMLNISEPVSGQPGGTAADTRVTYVAPPGGSHHVINILKSGSLKLVRQAHGSVELLPRIYDWECFISPTILDAVRIANLLMTLPTEIHLSAMHANEVNFNFSLGDDQRFSDREMTQSQYLDGFQEKASRRQRRKPFQSMGPESTWPTFSEVALNRAPGSSRERGVYRVMRGVPVREIDGATGRTVGCVRYIEPAAKDDDVWSDSSSDFEESAPLRLLSDKSGLTGDDVSGSQHLFGIMDSAPDTAVEYLRVIINSKPYLMDKIKQQDIIYGLTYFYGVEARDRITELVAEALDMTSGLTHEPVYGTEPFAPVPEPVPVPVPQPREQLIAKPVIRQSSGGPQGRTSRSSTTRKPAKKEKMVVDTPAKKKKEKKSDDWMAKRLATSSVNRPMQQPVTRPGRQEELMSEPAQKQPERDAFTSMASTMIRNLPLVTAVATSGDSMRMSLSSSSPLTSSAVQIPAPVGSGRPKASRKVPPPMPPVISTGTPEVTEVFSANLLGVPSVPPASGYGVVDPWPLWMNVGVVSDTFAWTSDPLALPSFDLNLLPSIPFTTSSGAKH